MKIVLLRVSVILGMLAGFALSPKLWLSSRFYPLTPVWSFLKPLGSPGDYIVFFSVIALLIAAAILPRREILIALFVLLVWLVLQDQSRLQPWFYQYALMLLAIALAGPKRPAAALNTCCLIVAATYMWSGLAKLNPNFIGDTFPFLVRPFIGKGQLMGHWLVRVLAFGAPLLECAAGVGLLIRAFRLFAVLFAIAMHVFILVTVGPLGRGVNDVVWPWNVAMIAFLLILFFRRTDDPAPRDIIWGRPFAYQKIVLVLFGVMPVLSFFNLWDHYLSSALYSGNRNSGVVYLSDAAFDRLPDKIEDYVTEEDPSRNKLDIFDWSLGELNVPSYPEIRVYKNVAREICRYAADDQIGANLVADAMEASGWKVRFLGTNLPHSSVLSAVEENSADVLCISTTIVANLPSVAELVRTVRAKLNDSAPRMVLGGAAYRLAPQFAGEIAVDLREGLALLCADSGTEES